MTYAGFVLGSWRIEEKSQGLRKAAGKKYRCEYTNVLMIRIRHLYIGIDTCCVDPISDMFIRIKNAQKAGHETVHIPYSQFKNEIAKALERSEVVGKIEKKGKRVRKFFEIGLKYSEGEPIIHNIKLLSKPSRRVYVSYKELWKSKHDGVIIVSTPKGVMSSQEARKAKVGGELIAEIW